MQGSRSGAVRAVAASVLVGSLLAACGGADAEVSLGRSADLAPVSSTTEAPAATTSTAPPPTAPTTAPPPPAEAVAPASALPPAPTTAPPATVPFIERVVVETGFVPFATIGDVVLHHPGPFVERVGFHESNHDGARQMDPVESTARPLVLESRERGTGDRTAADIVVQPDTEIRSPVTGTVLRGGRYTLYCDHSDEYLVIEPDGRPGWEVKLLHFEGLQVGKGQRVEAGVTPVGVRGRVLPFESQVDELTAEPSWPHVHVEVVDPSIPDRPSPGGGC